MDLKAIMTGAPQPTEADQNLISRNSAEKEGKPAGFYKSIVLDVLSVLTALTFGFTYYRYLSHHLSPWFVLAALLAFSVVSVLQAFLATNAKRRTLIIFLEALAIMAFFFKDDTHGVFIIAGIVAFLCLLWGHFSSRSYLKNSVELPFFGASAKLLGKLTTGVVLFMVLVYTPQVGQGGVFAQPQTFETFFAWASNFLNVFYPNIPFNGSIGNLSHTIAATELEKNPTFQLLTPSSQQQAIDAQSAQIQSNVAQTTNVQVSPQEQTSNIVYQYINDTLASWKDSSQTYFVIGWVIVLFIVLRTIGVIYVWVAQFVSLIFYEMLLALGFMHVAEIPQTKEVIEY